MIWDQFEHICEESNLQNRNTQSCFARHNDNWVRHVRPLLMNLCNTSLSEGHVEATPLPPPPGRLALW